MTGDTPEVRSDKRRKKEREIEKKRRKRRKRRKGRKIESSFNSQKEKINILAEMLKISKSGCGSIYNI